MEAQAWLRRPTLASRPTMTRDIGEESPQGVREVGELRRWWWWVSVFANCAGAEGAGACWRRSPRGGAPRLHHTWAGRRGTPQSLTCHAATAKWPGRPCPTCAPECFEAGLGAPPVDAAPGLPGRARRPDTDSDPSGAGGHGPATQAVLRGGGSRGRFLGTGHGVHSPGFEGRWLLAEPPFPFSSPCTLLRKSE